MIATITISRRDERGEDRDFLVDITRDRDGDLFATCGEDVEELRTTNRYGSIETYPTGRLFQRKGEPIELDDDELLEAGQALAQLEALWAAERSRLREIFRPVPSIEADSASDLAEALDSLASRIRPEPSALPSSIPNPNTSTPET